MMQREKTDPSHSHPLLECRDHPLPETAAVRRGRDSPAWKAALKALLAHRPSPTDPVGVDTLCRNWEFRPSRPDGITAAVRLSILRDMARAPAHIAITPIGAQRRWIVYFVYLPSGGLTAAHRFTIERLRQADAKLCVVCAAASPAHVPAELARTTDALYWKDLPGFDFSAYALALHEVASRSPGADLLILNDSVFGPFVPVDNFWPMMRWDLTGFTASAQIQNHIQSYAFHLKSVDEKRARTLRTVLPARFAFNHYRGAVYGQETRFATVAARTMSVGALWYADGQAAGDPSIFAALPLLEAGFPFLKRSLLSKNAHAVERADLVACLRARNHPMEDI